MMWDRYKAVVRNNCTKHGIEEGVPYWKDHLFAETITYFLPFCLIALIPGVWISVQSGMTNLGYIDIGAALTLAIIALVQGLTVTIRKVIFSNYSAPYFP